MTPVNRLVDEQLRRASAKATETIVRRFGDGLGVWVGCGYPKSGTVWLCQLLSSCLELPYPRAYRLPVAMASVIHAHWLPDRRLPRTVYVIRDGRDVMVSLYFHEVRLTRGGPNPSAARKRLDRFKRVFGPGVDLDNIERNLPRFLESEFEKPSWVKASWPVHVDAWLDASSDRVACVRYEDLLASVETALGPAIEKLAHEPVDLASLRVATQRFSFERQARRAPGLERRNVFLRKGVAGDWRNYFSKEANEVFNQAAGPALRRLGYDVDP